MTAVGQARYGLQWIQQPAENMYPYIRERAEQLRWTKEFYEEQIALYNIFHHEIHIFQ
jgi:hypothetical protein